MQPQQANAIAATWTLAAGLIGMAGNVTPLAARLWCSASEMT